jgi:hypothetical protein
MLVMAGMYEASDSPETAEKACRSVLDEVFRAVDAPADDDTGISVEINVILRAVGVLGPAPAEERN